MDVTRFLFIRSAVFTVPPEKNRPDPCCALSVTETPLSGAGRGWDPTATVLMRSMWCFSLACVHVHKYTQIVKNVSRRFGIPGIPFGTLAWILESAGYRMCSRAQTKSPSERALNKDQKNQFNPIYMYIYVYSKNWELILILSDQIGGIFISFFFFM